MAWFFYRESAHEESSYSQMWGSPSSIDFQAVYWRCLATSLITCRQLNPDVTMAVYLNRPDLPVLPDLNVTSLFNALRVDVRVLDWKRRPPVVLATWGCQLFQLDVLEDLAGKPDGVTVFLDIDTVWVRPIGALSQAVEQYGILTYDLQVPVNDTANGLSPAQLRTLSTRYGISTSDQRMRFLGGEFLAVGPEPLRRIAEGIRDLWPHVLVEFELQTPTITREDEYLSVVYDAVTTPNDLGNQYIRRIWTNYPHRDVHSADLDLTIWHLPAEKRLGLQRLFRDLHTGRIRASTEADYIGHLSSRTGVPRRTLLKVTRDLFEEPGMAKNLLLTASRETRSRWRHRLPGWLGDSKVR